MTCPCGHYDYVDSTAKTLSNDMICMYKLIIFVYLLRFSSYDIDHREHGNRRIHEKLTGTSLLRGAIFDPNEDE